MDRADVAETPTFMEVERSPLRFKHDLRAEPEFEQFASLAATICGTPVAAVTLIADGMQWIKGAVGIGREEMPEEQSFCIHTVRAKQYLFVGDASTDPRFRTNPLVTGREHIRFYAGMPLVIDDEPVGALCGGSSSGTASGARHARHPGKPAAAAAPRVG